MPVESAHRAEENVDMCQTLELRSRQIDVDHFTAARRLCFIGNLLS